MSWCTCTSIQPTANRLTRRRPRRVATTRPLDNTSSIVTATAAAAATIAILLMTIGSVLIPTQQHYVGMADAMIIPTTRSSTTSTTSSLSSSYNNNIDDDDDGSSQNRVWASKVAHSFKTYDFKPSWYATNPHLQTIVSVLYRKETMYTQDFAILRDLPVIAPTTTTNTVVEREELNVSTGRRKKAPLDEFQWDRRQRISTDDGDFYDVDWKYADAGGRRRGLLMLDDDDDDDEGNEQVTETPRQEMDLPVVIICHGLESCSDSPLAKDMAMSYNAINMDAICINFRGCSGECNLTPRAYHLGFTDDLFHLIRTIQGGQKKLRRQQRRIYLSGFSLGAGVVTKLLTELGDDAPKYNICGAAVNAVPLDVSQCASNLNDVGLSKSLYGNRLLRSMKKRLHAQCDVVSDFPFDREEIDKCESIMDFENLLIAPTFGFVDAWDYYDKCKTIDSLHTISVPQYILQALDDPFFQGMVYPNNDPNCAVNIQFTQYGGHCGYVFQTENENKSKTSWMPTQLARFLAHVEEQRWLGREERQQSTVEAHVDVIARGGG